MTHSIELKGISKIFDNKVVLRQLTFAVDPGQIIGYIGPNGAGKSTTIKIIMGLVQPDAGEVYINGELIDTTSDTYKKKLGYVPEASDIFEVLTATEYLTFIGQLYGIPEEVAAQKSRKLLDIIGIGKSADNRLSTYSKGMRQIVLLIGALIHDPDIIFLDEPLNGIDANTVLVIEEILAKLRDQGKTIFYSSHIMDVVQRLSDTILVLNNGAVAASGTYKELSTEDQSESLQALFNKLTGFQEHGQIATAFVEELSGGTGDDATVQ